MSLIRDTKESEKTVETIGEIIREAMADRGFSIAEVASRIGIGRQTFSRKLNGHVDFSASEITSLGEVVGVPAWELVRRAEESLTTTALTRGDDAA